MKEAGPNPFGDDLTRREMPLGTSRSRPASCLIAGAFVVLAVVGFFGLVFWLAGNPPSVDERVTRDAIEAVESQAANAFQNSTVKDSNPELVGITRLFEAMAAAADDESTATFTTHVDIDRFFDQVQRVKDEPITRLQAAASKSDMRSFFGPPSNWAGFDIVRIVPINSGEVAIVHAFLWIDEEAISFRAWVSKDENQWSLFDWEMMEHGLRRSEMYAAISVGDEDPRTFKTDLAYDAIESAGDAFLNDEPIQASKSLYSATGRGALPQFQNDIYYRAGLMWAAYDYHDEAMSCFERVDPTDSTPGGVLG